MCAYTNPLNKFSSGLPSSVKVGPVAYEIAMENCPKATGPEGEDISVFGMVNFKKSLITIDDELTPMMQWQCLWHELVHIVFEQLGFDQNENEGQVDAMAYKLLEILVDNGFLTVPTEEKFPVLETSDLLD